MSKIGVGVGEDFPVDENDKEEPAVEDLGTCHQRHRARREAWRRFKQQMHQEWHPRRRAFRDAVNENDDVEAIHVLRDKQLHHLIIGGLAVLGLAAIIAGLRQRD